MFSQWYHWLVTLVPLVPNGINIFTICTNFFTNGTIGNYIGPNGKDVTNQWFHWRTPNTRIEVYVSGYRRRFINGHRSGFSTRNRSIWHILPPFEQFYCFQRIKLLCFIFFDHDIDIETIDQLRSDPKLRHSVQRQLKEHSLLSDLSNDSTDSNSSSSSDDNRDDSKSKKKSKKRHKHKKKSHYENLSMQYREIFSPIKI